MTGHYSKYLYSLPWQTKKGRYYGGPYIGKYYTHAARWLLGVPKYGAKVVKIRGRSKRAGRYFIGDEWQRPYPTPDISSLISCAR